MAVIIVAAAAWGQSVSTGSATSRGASVWTTTGNAQSSTENVYCGPGDMPSFGLSDGPATLPAACVYTGNSTGPATVKTICPSGQTQSITMPSPGLACDYSTIQAAVTASAGNPGIWYLIKATSTGLSSGTQNVYAECVAWPSGTGGSSSTWDWFTTDLYASLPPSGSRVNPGYVGTASLSGYPSYTPPASGVYMPKIRCGTTNTSTFALDASTSYKRFIGLEVTSLSGVAIQNSLFAMPLNGTFGSDHIIVDRSLIHGGDSPTWTNEAASVQRGVRMAGTYLAVVDSWVGRHCVFREPALELARNRTPSPGAPEPLPVRRGHTSSTTI